MISGCIKRTTVVPKDQRLLTAETKSRQELMADLEARSAGLDTISAKVLLDATTGSVKTGVLEEYRQSPGYILADRNSQLRITVQALAVTIFTMASNGKEYRAFIPYKNLFIIADADAPASSTKALENLRPRHMLDAIFIDIRPYLNNPNIKPYMEEVVQGRTSYYVLSFVDISGSWAELREKFWIDRTSLQVVRKQTYLGDGKLEEDVEYFGYEEVGNTMFPMVINMKRPIEDYSLRIAVQKDKLTINEKLPEGAFLLDRPAGSQLSGEKPKPKSERDRQ